MCIKYQEVYRCGWVNETPRENPLQGPDPRKPNTKTYECQRLISEQRANNGIEGELHTNEDPQYYIPVEICPYGHFTKPCPKGVKIVHHRTVLDPQLRPCYHHDQWQVLQKQQQELNEIIRKEELQLLEDIRHGKARPSNVPQHPGPSIYGTNTEGSKKLPDRQATLDLQAQLAPEHEEAEARPTAFIRARTSTESRVSDVLESAPMSPVGGSVVPGAVSRSRPVAASQQNAPQPHAATTRGSSQHPSRHSSKERASRSGVLPPGGISRRASPASDQSRSSGTSTGQRTRGGGLQEDEAGPHRSFTM